MRLQTLIISAAVALTASAVPAMRGLRPMVQPDGSIIMIERVGSERAHATLDGDGHLLTLADGYYVPARIDELGRTVRTEALTRFTEADAVRLASATVAPRRARRSVPDAIGKFPGSTFPGLGSPKALVILVQYSDVKFTLGSKAATYFNAMLTEPGFSDPTYGGTGSCLDYFTEASMGKFTPDFDIYGPVTLKNDRSYYGSNDIYGNDRNAHLMAIEACEQLDSEVDFSQYDTDGDGYIDNVFIFYAGQGEASYGPDESVWPHAWTIYDALEGGPCPEFDGVLLNSYGCSNEWESNRPDGIGTFCHEFSHVIGLPDLYSTTTELTCTPGTWSVLDYGPYNNNGRTPPTYSTFERNAMGWIDLIELNADDTETVTIPDLRTSNVGYCITNPSNPNEFYLFESRNRQGTDAYIPADGMLVWHIDYNADIWLQNIVNDSRTHQYVDMIEADGKANKTSRNAGDCFPGSSNVTTLSTSWWDKSSTGININDIARKGTEITFTISKSQSSGETNPPSVTDSDYTVADVINSTENDYGVTLTGYIVGWVYGSNFLTGARFSVNDDNVSNTNCMLADTADETDPSYCIPVQLPAGTVRSSLNLKDNPSLLGRRVMLTGNVERYFATRGFKSVSDYVFIPDEAPSAIDDITADASAATNEWYTIQGRRVAAPTAPGLYISTSGRKLLLR